MEINPAFGVFLHAIGGLAAASFYIPCKRVKGWAWEVYWLVLGAVAWIIAPWVAAYLTVPNLLDVLSGVPTSVLVTSFFYGALWGIGGIMYGLTMRYLGISLGIAVALGFCAAFGTLGPPIQKGEFLSMLSNNAGIATLLGVVICLVGIAISGLAGIRKDRELSEEQKQDSTGEFSIGKGLLVGAIAGVMSGFMPFALDAGSPLAEAAIAQGAGKLWSNSPVYIVAFAGGFVINLIWCLGLSVRNGTVNHYVRNAEGSTEGSQVLNYLLCAVGGVTWYLQFMFYGMGSTQMGEEYKYSSWTLHMAFIIIFGSLWGLWLQEWRGVKPATMIWIWAGIGVLILSTLVVGLGNYLAALTG